MQHVLELDGGSVELALRTLTRGAIDSNASVFLKTSKWYCYPILTHWHRARALNGTFRTLPQIVSTSGGDELECNRRRAGQLWFGATCHCEDAVAFADIPLILADRLYPSPQPVARATDHAPTAVCFTAGIAFNDMAPATGQLSRASLAARNDAGCRNGRIVRLCRASSYQPTRHRKERAWDALATKDGPRSTGT